jgi:rhodanese-related sulfurtransferase
MQSDTVYDRATPTRAGYRDVSPDLADAVRGHVRMIDVRERDEFTGDLGHIPGAELVPLATLSAAARHWDRGAEYIIVCRSGGRSGRAAHELVAAGFRRVMNLAGGMLAYASAGLPVERT